MSEPKFHVGQAVAVCTKDFELIIPKTLVTAKRYDEEGITHYQGRAWKTLAGWWYQAEGAIDSARGEPWWIREPSLRAIDPDKEYQDSEIEELEQTK